MRYLELQPSPAARPFIDAYWILQQDAAEPPSIQRIVPDGHAELIVNLGAPCESFADGRWTPQPRCFLAGQITGPLLIRPGGATHIVGVRFRPHGAAAVLGIPMGEATGKIVPVDDFHPALARDLERVRESGAAPVLEAALLRRQPRPDLLLEAAVRRITETAGAVDIPGVAEYLGLSRRQLERRFQHAVGLAPKLFCRIQRFQSVFHTLDEGCPGWVDAAVQSGYYDQAHLIRDCKDFSGETPAVLLADADLARHFLRARRMSHSSNTKAPGFA